MSAASVFGVILVLLAVGRALRARGVVPEGSADTLNVVALYVSMPASILLNVPELTFHRELLGLVAIPWILLAASVALLAPIARVLRADRATSACLLMQTPLGNTAFMGYALVPALAGEGALRYAVVYDQFGSFLILATYGLFVVASKSGAARPTLGAVVRRVVLFPPFIALVVGVTIVPRELPPSVRLPLEMVSGTLLPLVGLALGMQLKLALPRRHLGPLGVAVVGKLVVVPLGALGLCALFGVGGEMRAAAILESAMPTMMTTAALLSMADLAPDLASAIVGYGTVASMISLPLWRSAL
ncbi:MAG: AEC family transporter [Labilithrix sp.]|nr:AEC family transporter [Labilithrix sp.]MCW5832718.1 AEC family transporter [Labilithrix sp.]